MVKVFIFSGLRQHDCCQIKHARRPPNLGKKTAQSAKTAPHHMKTPNLTLHIQTGNTVFRSNGNAKRFGLLQIHSDLDDKCPWTG
jgi:hypothetical protein